MTVLHDDPTEQEWAALAKRCPPWPVPHPAVYSKKLLPILQAMLAGEDGPVLDPMAGTGRIHALGRDDTVGVELEPEWAAWHERTIVGDARALPWPDDWFGAICVSPAYGNRMADAYDGRDGSKRRTYRLSLGRPLSEGNGGGLQWGEEYRTLHRAAWNEAARVLRPGGAFILNCSDHIRGGVRQLVTSWHLRYLLDLGFVVEAAKEVPTPRYRFGANHDRRTPAELVVKLRLVDPA